MPFDLMDSKNLKNKITTATVLLSVPHEEDPPPVSVHTYHSHHRRQPNERESIPVSNNATPPLKSSLSPVINPTASTTMVTIQSFVAILLASFTHPTIAKSPNSVANTITNVHRPSATYRHPSVDSCYSNSNRVAILKRHEEQREGEEYVTSFYKRVRDKRRAFFDRQLQQHEEQLHPQGDNKDHSLDHYFDHQLLSTAYTKESSSPVSSSLSNAARRVRGGATSAVSSAPADQGESRSSTSKISPSKHDYKRYHRRHQAGCSRGHHSEVDDYDEYDLHDCKIEEQNPERHLRLLRVPCNIAINPEDASLKHRGPSQSAYRNVVSRSTIIA